MCAQSLAAMPPDAWILVGDKAGDNAQLRALAAAAQLSVEEKPVLTNGWRRLPNLLLGASGLSVSAATRAQLAAPWPRLILASGRKSAAVALSIKRRSGGRSKLVHVGRPWAPLRWFDLVLTQPQYHLPAAANVMACALPFNALAPARLEAEARRWAPVWAHLPKPWLAVIVGGTARPLVLDVATARAIGRAASQFARQSGGSLLVSTSRRTPDDAADALVAAIDAPHFLFRWRAEAAAEQNPYAGMLALADRILVTGDSASMLAEALRSGKPVAVAALPVRPDARQRLAAWARGILPGGLSRWLLATGIMTSVRDLAALTRPLIENGQVRDLATIGQPCEPFVDQLPRAAARVRALLG